MPLVALAILMGALIAFYGNQSQDPFWGSFLPLLLLAARYNPKYRFLVLLLAGMLWSGSLLNLQLSNRLVDDFDNKVVSLDATIADLPRVDSDRVSFLIEEIEIAGYTATPPRRARISWYQTSELPQAGERWQFLVRIRQPRGLLNPAGPDYERWLFVKGVDATGYVLRARENGRLQAAPLFSLDSWRDQLAKKLERDCQHCRQLGLIKALVLGFRGDIDDDVRDLLQSTGTSHLLAISGLHIGMVALLGFGIGRLSWRLCAHRHGIHRRQLASICALILAVSYAALAGFSLPTIRALLMLLVVLLAMQLNRKLDLLQSTSLALVIILMFDPLSVGAASFWLSFGAMMVIGFFLFRQRGRTSKWSELFLLQVFFTLLFAPLGLLIFGQLNPASLPANLLAIPALSLLVLPTVLAASLMSAIDFPAAGFLLGLVDQALAYLLLLLEWLLDAGLQSFKPAVGNPVLILLVILSLLMLMLPRWSVLPVMATATLLTLLSRQPVDLHHGEFEMTVLDVGMGSSILVRTRHHSMVYDFGPGRRGKPNSADRYLLPLLRKKGIEQPDLLVVSHVDQDHSGGIAAFIGRYRPHQLISGTPYELRQRFDLEWLPGNCHGYPGWSWDGVEFRFLPLQTATVRATNNRSCVLQVLGFQRILLPGDIEVSQEAYLVDAYPQSIAADVLLAPHHGSKTSSSEEFIRFVDPDLAIFMTSRNNRWGFPDNSVVQRYLQRGVRLLGNDQQGAIVLTSRDAGLSVRTARTPPRRIWQRW